MIKIISLHLIFLVLVTTAFLLSVILKTILFGSFGMVILWS